MKRRKAGSTSRALTLRVDDESYLQAVELKNKLKARTWSELFTHLLELSRSLPQSTIEKLRSKKRGGVKFSDEEIRAYLEELMRPCGRTALDEVLAKHASGVVHSQKAIKILLALMSEELGERAKK